MENLPSKGLGATGDEIFSASKLLLSLANRGLASGIIQHSKNCAVHEKWSSVVVRRQLRMERFTFGWRFTRLQCDSHLSFKAILQSVDPI